MAPFLLAVVIAVIVTSAIAPFRCSTHASFTTCVAVAEPHTTTLSYGVAVTSTCAVATATHTVCGALLEDPAPTARLSTTAAFTAAGGFNLCTAIGTA